MNESAFPTSNWQNMAPLSSGYSEGMTLRDYFAAKAMQGFHANTNSDQLKTETYEEYVSDLARCAYQQADAMMKARQP